MWGEETAGAETQGDKNPDLFTVGGNVTGVATMKNSMDAPQKVKNSMYVCMIQLYDPAIPTSGYTSKRNENRLLKRSLHSHVYGSIIHSSQDMETI